MPSSRLLISGSLFAKEFERCCREYETLNIATAWCGNPSQTLPYAHIKNFKGKIRVIAGISFNHTHPEAFEWFLKCGANIRVFCNESMLFHPKIYLFEKGKLYALFIGSSNLTYGGFYANCEANVLIEGDMSEETNDDIPILHKLIDRWHTPDYSFEPTKQWLKKYRKEYDLIMSKQKRNNIPAPHKAEQDIPMASWLGRADWNVYYSKVLEGLDKHGRSFKGYHDVLDVAAQTMAIPWTTADFDDIEKRRIIGGMEPYGWLGHVAASGQFRRLLVNGPLEVWNIIVEQVNALASLNHPLPWSEFESHLKELTLLGPTMKVWSRVLCIVRPDIYCTVAAPSVRKNLSETLGMPQNRFISPQGYVQLIRLIHLSPWFNSSEPAEPSEAAIWRRRSAFLDAIFY